MDIDFSHDYTSRTTWSPAPKTQIILCNTNADLNDHLIKLKNRHNGKYNRIPHFTIANSGQIYQHASTDSTSKFIGFDEVDNQAIIITLENVGWLTYSLRINQFYDWKGNEYYDEHLERTWRGKKFWATYKKEQIESLLELLNYLCKECNIEKDFTGNNVTMSKARTHKGILCRSNYNKYYYDLSPAMDFEYIKNNLIYDKL
jgi:N-acetyl-anhydromuramyl-L-alanine amidase AmpD